MKDNIFHILLTNGTLILGLFRSAQNAHTTATNIANGVLAGTDRPHRNRVHTEAALVFIITFSRFFNIFRTFSSNIFLLHVQRKVRMLTPTCQVQSHAES